MTSNSLLEALYMAARHSGERPSTSILRLDTEDEKVGINITFPLSALIYERMKELAEFSDSSIEEFMIDCLAHGFVEIGKMIGVIAIKEADMLEKYGKDIVEH